MHKSELECVQGGVRAGRHPVHGGVVGSGGLSSECGDRPGGVGGGGDLPRRPCSEDPKQPEVLQTAAATAGGMPRLARLSQAVSMVPRAWASARCLKAWRGASRNA